MDNKVKNALEGGISSYASLENIDAAEFQAALFKSFALDAPFMDKVAAMDAVFDDFQAFDELREVAFDLLMINFFAEDVQKLEEDYLESEEWERSEERRVGKECRSGWARYRWKRRERSRRGDERE